MNLSFFVTQLPAQQFSLLPKIVNGGIAGIIGMYVPVHNSPG
jgi:hypothetical protein